MTEPNSQSTTIDLHREVLSLCLIRGRFAFASLERMFDVIGVSMPAPSVLERWRDEDRVLGPISVLTLRSNRPSEEQSSPPTAYAAWIVHQPLALLGAMTRNIISTTTWVGSEVGCWGNWLLSRENEECGKPDPPKVIFFPALHQMAGALLTALFEKSFQGESVLQSVLTIEDWGDALLSIPIYNMVEMTDFLVAHSGCVTKIQNELGDGVVVLLSPSVHLDKDDALNLLRYKQRTRHICDSVARWEDELRDVKVVGNVEESTTQLRVQQLEVFLAENKLIHCEILKMNARLRREADGKRLLSSIEKHFEPFGGLDRYPLL